MTLGHLCGVGISTIFPSWELYQEQIEVFCHRQKHWLWACVHMEGYKVRRMWDRQAR